jgi:phage gp29-like protein
MMLKSNVNLLAKSMDSFKLLASLFENLSLHQSYFNHLKSDGYIRKLVKKLYRNPEKLDVMDNALDLTEALSKIEKEINEVEAIIKPITKAVYGDSDDKFDEDVVKLYQNMAEKEKD